MAQGYHLHQDVVHVLQKAIVFGDNGSTVTIGTIPSGSVVIGGGVSVNTAFNAGTSNVLDVGSSDDTDGFGTDLALGTVGVISLDEMATTNDQLAAADVTIVAIPTLTGTAATTGAGRVWVEFIPPVSE